MAIDLHFSEEQALIRDTARAFLAEHVPPAAVRKYQNNPEEYPRDLWAAMAELGWLGMPFAEAHGGMGAGLLDMLPLAQELGRCLAPVPFLETVALGGGLVAALGSPAQKDAILPAIAAGRMVLTPAVLEPDGACGADGVRLTAEGGRLTGRKALVGYAGVADRLIVAAREGAGVSAYLVDPKAEGMARERLPNAAGLPLYAMSFDGAAGERLGPEGGAWAALDEVRSRGQVLLAAMVAGAGERVLEISADYARTRVQFGEPIGKHQAVQYLVTDIAIAGHNVGLLALHAAWLADTGQPFRRAAAFAKAAASRAAAAMTHAGHEVHAGIAFMLDYDLQLYTFRGKHWEYQLGDHRSALEQAAGG
jgi:alkylation response protein AidB-like acyl-CoA dehydrogenase